MINQPTATYTCVDDATFLVSFVCFPTAPHLNRVAADFLGAILCHLGVTAEVGPVHEAVPIVAQGLRLKPAAPRY
jgi:hypothetical protein